MPHILASLSSVRIVKNFTKCFMKVWTPTCIIYAQKNYSYQLKMKLKYLIKISECFQIEKRIHKKVTKLENVEQEMHHDMKALQYVGGERVRKWQN